jgi:hypothetical protein
MRGRHSRRRAVLSVSGVGAVLVSAGLAVAALTGSAKAVPWSANPAGETIGPMVTTPWLDDADAPPAIVTVSGSAYAIVSDGSGVWHRWEGTSVDDMSEQGIVGYSSLTQHDEGTGGDDRYWLTDIWVSSADLWYGFVHVEYDYTYNPADVAIGHTRRVVLAESTDQGATWTYVGDILTPSASAIPGAPAGAENYGDGDQRLVVDSANGYLYLYYTTGYYLPGQTMSTGNPVSWSNVARCPIAQIASPGCWRKWAGSWSAATPGAGGAEIGQADQPLPRGLAGPSSIPMLTYDQGSGQFLAIGNGEISTAGDLGTQNWTTPATVTGDLSVDSCWYLWAYGPDTSSRYVVNQEFRLYGGGGGCSSVTRYQQLNLVSGPQSAGPSAQDPWLYQYVTGGTVEPMTWQANSGAWQGSQAGCEVSSSDQQQPGAPGECDAARPWQAPSAMTVSLGASDPIAVGSCSADCGEGVELQILLDGKQLWPAAGQSPVIIQNGGTYTFPGYAGASGTGIAVKAGDQLQFVTTAVGATSNGDTTTWDPAITEYGQDTDGYTPSPWRYQYTADGTAFSPMSFQADISAWTSPDAGQYCEVSDSDLQSPGYPGDCEASRTWQAPYVGTVTISTQGEVSVAGGASVPACGGNTAGVDIQIRRNGTPVTVASTVLSGQSASPASVSLSVNAGDDIEFVTSANGNNNWCDNVTWDPVVSYPSTGQSWQAADSFVQVEPWEYLYSTTGSAAGATYEPMAYSTTSSMWLASSQYQYCDVYAASQQEPALDCAASRAWRAPYATTVVLPPAAVSVASCPASAASTCSPGVTAEIVLTGADGTVQQVIASSGTVAHGGSATFPAVPVAVAVSPGDDIGFVTVADGTDNNWYDNVTWSPVISDSGALASETEWYAGTTYNQG